MNKFIPIDLINLMQDQHLHSGESIAASLGLSRAAVWKQIKRLDELGVRIESKRGQGYRMLENLELIDQSRITEMLRNEFGFTCHYYPSIDSTNSELLRMLQNSNNLSRQIVISEMQTSGRGRRGKKWFSPFAKNLYLSVLWRFECSLQALEGLSLVVGISIIDGLKMAGVDGVKLKWPNDILYEEKKIGGILIELQGEAGGSYNAIIGVGLNIFTNKAAGSGIEQPWGSLEEVAGFPVSRQDILEKVFRSLFVNLETFERTGFEAFHKKWLELDVFHDRPVMVLSGNEVILGIAKGVNPAGELVLEVNGARRIFSSGEVSLRPDL